MFNGLGVHVDRKVATSKFKFLAITTDNIYAYKRKKDLLIDLGMDSFKKSVIRVYKVKDIWAGNG